MFCYYAQESKSSSAASLITEVDLSAAAHTDYIQKGQRVREILKTLSSFKRESESGLGSISFPSSFLHRALLFDCV